MILVRFETYFYTFKLLQFGILRVRVLVYIFNVFYIYILKYQNFEF